MKYKLIAIGNRIMSDDGAAIAAAEILSEELNTWGIETIIGETDMDYCLSCINEEDALLVLDAAVSGKEAGAVWWLQLEQALDNLVLYGYPHDTDLLALLKLRALRPQGLLICIEAAELELRLGLSERLQSRLPEICREIKDIILEYRGGKQNA